MSKQLNIRFYQNVAKIFYAIAAVDKIVRNEEFDKLKSIVKNEWLPVDDSEDEFHTDAAYQLEIVFDWLLSKELNATTCFNEFIDYKEEHEYFFTDTIKALILKTASEVAASFHGKNKAELIMLAKLDMNFKQTTYEK